MVLVIPMVIYELGTVAKGLEKSWGNWKSQEESRPFKQLHCQDRMEYPEVFWRPDEICCHSFSNEKSLVDATEENSQRVS